MKNVVEIPKTQVMMTFVATCIETTARLLNTSYKEVYERMKRVGLIEEPCGSFGGMSEQLGEQKYLIFDGTEAI